VKNRHLLNKSMQSVQFAHANTEGDAGGAGGEMPAVVASDAVAGADVAAQLAALTAQFEAQSKTVAELTAANAKAAAAAEESRTKSLTSEQKLQEDRDKVDADRKVLVAEARTAALTKLNIATKFFEYAPAVDPRTTEGAAIIESWAAKNPEFAAVKTEASILSQVVGTSGKLADILSGKTKNPLITTDSLKKMFGQ